MKLEGSLEQIRRRLPLCKLEGNQKENVTNTEEHNHGNTRRSHDIEPQVWNRLRVGNLGFAVELNSMWLFRPQCFGAFFVKLEGSLEQIRRRLCAN